MAGTQIHAPEIISEELAGAQPQALSIQLVSMVSLVSHSAYSSHPPSIGVRDIKGLTSSDLADLTVTFQIDFLGRTHSMAAAPPLQFLVVKDLVRGRSGG